MRIVLLLLIAFIGWATGQRSGDLRLVQDGISQSSYTRGRLELYFDGRWGTVCDDHWSSTENHVACRQLGLSNASTSWTTSSAGGYGPATGTIWFVNVRCSGSESRLISCPRTGLRSHNCSHSDDLAIDCSFDGDLRLVRNGNSSSSNTRGRLEFYYSGRWGTVCNIGWSSTETHVACRQLGLPTISTSWTTSSAGGYGSTTGMIWLDNVRCSGTESRLTNCLTTILGSNDCSHSEDVAIECNDGPDIGTAWVVVGVSLASLVLFVIIPTICIIIVCIMRRRTTAHPAVSSTTTVTKNSDQQNVRQENMYAQRQTAQQHTTQQFDSKAYPATDTDLKQVPPPAYEMHTAFPAPSLITDSQKQSQQAPPPAYEMQAIPPPSPLTTSSQQQFEQAPTPTYEIQPTPTPSSHTTTTSISTEV